MKVVDRIRQYKAIIEREGNCPSDGCPCVDCICDSFCKVWEKEYYEKEHSLSGVDSAIDLWEAGILGYAKYSLDHIFDGFLDVRF